MGRSADAARAIIEPVVVGEGYDLDDLSVMAAGRRRLVKVVVDRDGGLTLDDAAALSRAISAALDDDDPMGSAAYVLEVTSRGVDRPLTLPRHFRRNIGRLVDLTLLDDESVSGRIADATDTAITLATGDDPGNGEDPLPRVVTLEQITKATVRVELNRPKS